jgi:acylphosphatase
MTKIDKPKFHSLIITGKVQDIGFRSIVEHIGRSFGMPGMVFNAKDGSVKILCSGADSVIENFTQTIKIRGAESGAEIIDIKESTHIELPDDFSKASSDDEIDIGRKLDKGNEFLKTLPEMKDLLATVVIEMRDHNREQSGHNTRLEAILQKLADKA